MKNPDITSWQRKYTFLSTSLRISLQKIPSLEKLDKILSLLCTGQNPICSQHTALFLLKEKKFHLTAACNFNHHHCSTPPNINSCHCGVVAYKAKTRFFSGQEQPPCPSPKSAMCNTPHYCVPLSDEEGVLGVLILFCKETEGSKEATEFLHDIAHIIETILSTIKVEERSIKEMAEHNRLSTLAEIASSVAHEVRNPLASIRGMAQSIEEEVDHSSHAYECSTRIVRQVDRLNQFLCDFFNYARPKKSKTTQIDIEKTITDTLALVEKKLSRAKIQFHFEIQKSIPTITADQNHIQQVLLNLFLNSIDAIQQNGHISLTIETITDQKQLVYTSKFEHLKIDTDDVLFRFADNGTGMSKKNIHRIFDPFFTTKKDGVGLGLATVYRILKENRAFIFAENSPNSGAIFYIFFKRA